MSQQHPFPPPPSMPIPVALPKDSSVWDRISNWASENKAVVYTIAGVTVVFVAGAGVFYYTKDGSVRRQPLAMLGAPQSISPRWNYGANMPSSNRQNPMRNPNSVRRRGGSERKPRRKPRQSEMLPPKRPHRRPRLPALTAPTRSQNSPRTPSKPCRKMSVKLGLSS